MCPSHPLAISHQYKVFLDTFSCLGPHPRDPPPLQERFLSCMWADWIRQYTWEHGQYKTGFDSTHVDTGNTKLNRRYTSGHGRYTTGRELPTGASGTQDKNHPAGHDHFIDTPWPHNPFGLAHACAMSGRTFFVLLLKALIPVAPRPATSTFTSYVPS